MSLVNIIAKFSCDRCGTEFEVKLDPAYEPPAGWSAFDIAEDRIRSGIDYSDADETCEASGSGSVVGRYHLCRRCTDKRDAKEDRK